jgi:hypothetical protein
MDDIAYDLEPLPVTSRRSQSSKAPSDGTMSKRVSDDGSENGASTTIIYRPPKLHQLINREASVRKRPHSSCGDHMEFDLAMPDFSRCTSAQDAYAESSGSRKGSLDETSLDQQSNCGSATTNTTMFASVSVCASEEDIRCNLTPVVHHDQEHQVETRSGNPEIHPQTEATSSRKGSMDETALNQLSACDGTSVPILHQAQGHPVGAKAAGSVRPKTAEGRCSNTDLRSQKAGPVTLRKQPATKPQAQASGVAAAAQKDTANQQARARKSLSDEAAIAPSFRAAAYVLIVFALVRWIVWEYVF